MLVIRDAQIQAFIAETDDDLIRLIGGAIRKTNPPRVDGLTPERVDSMVRKGIEKARALGLQKAEEIGVVTALMFEISPQFADEPEIAAVLADTTYTPADRLSQLFDRVPAEAWSNAVDLYNENFWFADDRKEDAVA